MSEKPSFWQHLDEGLIECQDQPDCQADRCIEYKVLFLSVLRIRSGITVEPQFLTAPVCPLAIPRPKRPLVILAKHSQHLTR